MDSRQVSSDENYDAHECLQLQLLTLLNELDHTKQRESALRSATEQWQDTFDAIADAICVLDIENRIIRVNRAMCDLMGMTETAIIGRYCWDVVHGTGFPIAECPCMAVSSEAVRKNLVLQRGQRWYNVTVDPRFDTAGTLQGYIHVMSDISTVKLLEQEQLQTEARMRQAQKMEAIGTLAGGIAHDFNNILTAILGYSEMALDDAEQGQATPAYIRQILRAGERARDLVRQILTFSRQNEAGAKPIQIQPIVKEALKLLRASLPSTIAIDLTIETDAVVQADPIQIHQVIMNLCTNAGHAMRRGGGQLRVNLAEEDLPAEPVVRHPELNPGRYLRIRVSDTGHGIAPEIIERIFDPYFTTKPQGESTGMGLALVQGIVDSCGGVVCVESQAAQGTVFNIYLPMMPRPDKSALPDPQIVPLGHERILFVDDEPALAEMAREMLARLGYRVTISTASTEAFVLFKQHPFDFDLVITDMTMPHITGEMLARKMTAVRADIPIILCTGYSEDIDQESMARWGVHALVMKPLVRGTLAPVIRQVLDAARTPSADV